MKQKTKGLAQSVHSRLIRHAKETDVDPNLVLTRFATERLLYRLSQSRFAEKFVLKGALLLLVWLGESIRPTRDADLLGFGDLADESLVATFAKICTLGVEPDGVTFDPSAIHIAAIRPEDNYGGKRITLDGQLGSARIRVQLDIGIGDATIPEPEWLDYPSLLNMPQPRLLAYRPETAIAEKVHAMVLLGMRNSRLRDFFDIYVLSRHEPFEGSLLVSAIRATFERRKTVIPEKLPTALTPAFAQAADKRAQWQGFLRKNHLTIMQIELEDVIASLAEFLGPVLTAASENNDFKYVWKPSGPWQAK